MRTFILLCFVAAASAQYSYGAGQSEGVNGGPSGGSGGFPFPSSGGYIKEFFTFVAPEDKIDPATVQKLASMIKKNIRVIFIKNPENKAFEDAVINLAKQAAEQKTAIYVLNKQHDIADLANKFNAIRDNANAKPEVHFVKYRTPEDAANAQQVIQSQYDALKGTSKNINGGVAPALNFASQSPQSAPSGGGQATQPIYLPSSVFRRYRTVRRV